MLAFIVRVLLTAVLFTSVLGRLPLGVQFLAPLIPTGMLFSAMFVAASLLLEGVSRIFSTLFIIGTFGLGAIVVKPLQLIVLILIPTTVLIVLQLLFPYQLALVGPLAALKGGMVLAVCKCLFDFLLGE